MAFTAAVVERPVDRSRRERRKQEVRRRILEAAIALFDEKGFAATMVSEICERADVAHKTFFNHFVSKPHLLREVARVQLERLLELVGEVRRGPGSTRQRLERFFRLLADRIEQAGPMRRELLTELVHLAHESGTGSAQARSLHDAFAALLRDGLAAGELRREHAVGTLTEVVVGVFYALLFNWANFDGYPFRRQALAAARFLGDALTIEQRRRR